MPEAESGVVVTLADIYHAQLAQGATLAEIQGTLALTSQNTRNTDATLIDHESRMRKVETKVVLIPSAATVIMAAALAWSVFGR